MQTRDVLPQPVLGLPDPGERVPRLAWPTVSLYVGTLALAAIELLGFFTWGWSPWVTVPIGAVVAFLMFSVLHDSTHHAISTNTKVNNAFGILALPWFVAWATFSLVKFIHIEHHRNTNEDKLIDPDAWCEEGPWWQLPFRWATIDIWYLIFYLRRIATRPKRESVVAITWALTVWGAFAVLVAAGYGYELLMAYVLPQRIGIVVLAWWFDYLPHHGLSATQREDKYRATRVRVGGESLITPVLVYQNYHLVHHLHPSIPFYRYIRAWRRNEQAYLDRNAAISTWFGRSLTPNEYRTWRRLTDQLNPASGADADHRPVFHPLRVRAVEPLTADSVTVSFDVPADLADEYVYRQGQHITLRAVIDGREQRRSYSLVDDASAGTLRVAVKRLPDGVFSSYVNSELRAGDIIDVLTPMGGFHVDLEHSATRHHVGIAAGSGITPIMSTIATTLDKEPASRFTLVYGNRTAESTMFRAELDALRDVHGERLVIHHVLSQDPAAELTGRITPELVDELLLDADVHAWFVCGPEQMVDAVSARLGSASGQVLTEVFHFEHTTGSAVAIDVNSEVTIALDGVESTFTLSSLGEPILDAALQAGIDPPYSCAGGACGTCQARVTLGRAVMDQNHVLSEAQVDDGYILTCQAHPVTEEVHIDYHG